MAKGRMTKRRVLEKTFALVEEKLREYPLLKKMIQRYEQERNDIAGQIGSPMARLGEITKGEGQPGDPTFHQTFRLLRYEEQVTNARWFVDAIEDVLSILNDLDKGIVKLKYFQDYYTDTGVCHQLNISRSKLYKRRREILKKFAKRMGYL